VGATAINAGDTLIAHPGGLRSSKVNASVTEVNQDYVRHILNVPRPRLCALALGNAQLIHNSATGLSQAVSLRFCTTTYDSSAVINFAWYIRY
jgi:hypothetical protein